MFKAKEGKGISTVKGKKIRASCFPFDVCISLTSCFKGWALEILINNSNYAISGQPTDLNLDPVSAQRLYCSHRGIKSISIVKLILRRTICWAQRIVIAWNHFRETIFIDTTVLVQLCLKCTVTASECGILDSKRRPLTLLSIIIHVLSFPISHSHFLNPQKILITLRRKTSSTT